ncbi:hypothetical protein BCY88_27485 [Paraburkholderia fungorum]|uniref:Uncharacterized protein n=1 Tax=Paraburkholderia fungorum TaxID=134537 RepID=A0A3R7E5V1_9BURK|nr:hypothetical protein BCY88_27485 [Paraburkholderia fungorum]
MLCRADAALQVRIGKISRGGIHAEQAIFLGQGGIPCFSVCEKFLKRAWTGAYRMEPYEASNVIAANSTRSPTLNIRKTESP